MDLMTMDEKLAALAESTDAELLTRLSAANAFVKVGKEGAELITAELAKRHGAAVAAKLSDAGKVHGSTTYAIPGVDGAVLKGEVKRTVTWDQTALLGLCFSMPEAEARKVFKLEISVPEKAFADSTGNFRAALEAARTTKDAPMAFKVEHVAAKGAAA